MFSPFRKKILFNKYSCCQRTKQKTLGLLRAPRVFVANDRFLNQFIRCPRVRMIIIATIATAALAMPVMLIAMLAIELRIFSINPLKMFVMDSSTGPLQLGSIFLQKIIYFFANSVVA